MQVSLIHNSHTWSILNGSMSYSAFKQAIIHIVQMIPYGKVMSYGQIALYVGVPRSARQVGWVLNSTEGEIDLPWWRVVNNAGRVSIKGTRFNTAELQRKLLRSEGIPVAEDFTFPIETYRFVLTMGEMEKMSLDEKYIEQVLLKFPLEK